MDESIGSPVGDTGGSGSPAPSASPAPTSDSSSAAASASTGLESGAQTPDKGPIPYDRFAEVNGKYNSLRWAESLDQQRVSQGQQLLDWFDADPEGAYGYIGQLLRGQGMLREAQLQRQTQDERPEPDVVNPQTGQRFYSAEAAEKLLQWEMSQRLGPIEQRLHQQEAERVHTQAQREAQAALAEADTWPHFKEHQGEILAAMNKDKRLSLEGAYNRVVLPKLRTLERQAVLSEMGQKTRANTADPSATPRASNTPLHKLPIEELFKREMAKRGGRL